MDRNTGIFLSTKSITFFINKAVEVIMDFVRKPNVSYINLVTINLLKEIVSEGLSFITVANIERLTSLKLVWKQD